MYSGKYLSILRREGKKKQEEVLKCSGCWTGWASHCQNQKVSG